MVVRVQRCKQLLRRFSAGTHSTIVFNDEKFFAVLHCGSFYQPSKTTVLLLQMSLLPIQVVETLEGRLIPNLWWFEQSRLRTKNRHWPSLRKGWKSTKKSTKMRFSRIFSFLGPKPTSDNVPGLINEIPPSPTRPNPCNNGTTQICRISSTPLNGLPLPRFELLDYSIWNEL